MCGIFSFVGKGDATSIVVEGLKQLEYRGYDSSGLAIYNHGLQVHKCAGRVKELEKSLPASFCNTNIAMGHNRWATHGSPNDVNAHPHLSQDGKIAIVHNGIIENYLDLEVRLHLQGIQCISETDSEILVQSIAVYQQEQQVSTEKAMVEVLKQVEGSYSIVLMDAENPQKLLAARQGSPLVIGIGKDGYFLASDILPIVPYTDQVVYLEDGQAVIIDCGQFEIINFNHEKQRFKVNQIKINVHDAQKKGYKHYMLKEINEQSSVLQSGFKRHCNDDSILSEWDPWMERLKQATRIIILGCGSSWHASLVAEYVIESICRIPVEVEYASEFRYRNPIIHPTDIIIAISQSGETADTLVALEEAKKQGCLLYALVNVSTSSIARLVDVFTDIYVGPEIGVASTKAFTGQLMAIYLLAIKLGVYNKSISGLKAQSLLQELKSVAMGMESYLDTISSCVESIALANNHVDHALFLGRGIQFPIALEGALKLKEVSYIHAEGYPAAEMKHGPIALIEKGWPIVVMALKSDPYYSKICSNIEEIKARGGSVVAIIDEGDDKLKELVEAWIEIPPVSFLLSPMYTVIPMQLLAYYIGLQKGCDVDKPRNLAKSVTVE